MINIFISKRKLAKINTLLFVLYIFTPIIFHFISKYISSYILEYIITILLIVVSLAINKISKNIKKIILIILFYVLFHVFRDILLNTSNLMYYHVYKNIIYNGILVLFFMRKEINYEYMKKLIYQFSIYSFYIFYIEFIFFNSLYKSIIGYMTLGIYMMFPMCIFIFSFFLEGYKKKDLFYSICLFITIALYGNRSPILIIMIVTYVLLIIKFSKIKKVLLILFSSLTIINLKKIIYFLYINHIFKASIIVRKFYDFYNNIGTGILSGRNELYSKYIKDIVTNPIVGNNIKSELIAKGDYSHNIVIDIFHNNGLFLGIIIISIIIYILFTNIKSEIIFLSIFCMFLVLFFSSFYLLNRYFYILIIFCFDRKQIQVRKKFKYFILERKN